MSQPNINKNRLSLLSSLHDEEGVQENDKEKEQEKEKEKDESGKTHCK